MGACCLVVALKSSQGKSQAILLSRSVLFLSSHQKRREAVHTLFPCKPFTHCFPVRREINNYTCTSFLLFLACGAFDAITFFSAKILAVFSAVCGVAPSLYSSAIVFSGGAE